MNAGIAAEHKEDVVTDLKTQSLTHRARIQTNAFPNSTYNTSTNKMKIQIQCLIYKYCISPTLYVFVIFFSTNLPNCVPDSALCSCSLNWVGLNRKPNNVSFKADSITIYNALL